VAKNTRRRWQRQLAERNQSNPKIGTGKISKKLGSCSCFLEDLRDWSEG
jgi:hypothetical protein